jgi:PAS domain S-box-containing protein
MTWKFIEMFLPPRGLDEEKNRLNRIVHAICFSIAFLIFIPIYTNVGANKWNSVYILILEEVFLWFTLWLNYRGNLKWAIRLMMVSIFIMATLLVIFAGDGSHGISLLIYPAIIVVAGLLLNRRSFIIYTIIIILSITLIMIAEVKGLIITRLSAFVSIRNTVEMIIILGVTAFVVAFLTENLRQSVARNQALLSALPDIVFRLNRDGKFLDFSAPRNQTLFAQPQEFLGKKVDTVLPGPVAVQTMLAVNEALEKKNVVQFEYELSSSRRMDYWEARIVALQDEEVVVVVRNITASKQAEEQRRMSEEKFSHVFMTNPDSVTLTRIKDAVYIDVNEGFTRLSGYTREETIGHSTLEINIWENLEERSRLLALLHSQGRVDNLEAEFVRKDGSIISGLISASIIQIAGESCIITNVRDITEQKKMQRQLMQTQKIQSIGTLAGGIAHDFNNILGIIFGYADLAENRRLDAEWHKEGMHAIVQAAERGAELVNQILTFARKSEVIFLPINIPTLLRELLPLLKETFPKIITFTEHYEKDLPDMMGDKTQIHQALLNLCVNARDAMPHGGCISIDATHLDQDQVQLRFPTAHYPSYLRLRITDTGTGMDEEIRQRIFDPFFTTKELGKGTGLGLSVVYGILQSHQGFIDVESIVGKGTTFSLFFPATNIIGGKHQEELSTSELPHGTETLLIVEDEESLLAMLRKFLESHGYIIFEASDGEAALQLFARHHKEIALVLCDLGLPKINGIEIFKKMKEIDAAVQVIITSGFFEPQIKSELEKLGVKGFIPKPYNANQVILKIKEVLDKKKNNHIV